MIVEMHPSLKKVAEFMQRELMADELRSVAKGLAVIAPAIWAQYEAKPLLPMRMIEDPLTSGGGDN